MEPGGAIGPLLDGEFPLTQRPIGDGSGTRYGTDPLIAGGSGILYQFSRHSDTVTITRYTPGHWGASSPSLLRQESHQALWNLDVLSGAAVFPAQPSRLLLLLAGQPAALNDIYVRLAHPTH